MFWFQLPSTEASRCSVNWTEIRSGSDFVAVRFYSSSILACNFTLRAAEDSELHATSCDQDGASETSFVCQITGLSPGTLYHLIAISSTDGEKSDTTARTGEVVHFTSRSALAAPLKFM